MSYSKNVFTKSAEATISEMKDAGNMESCENFGQSESKSMFLYNKTGRFLERFSSYLECSLIFRRFLESFLKDI